MILDAFDILEKFIYYNYYMMMVTDKIREICDVCKFYYYLGSEVNIVITSSISRLKIEFFIPFSN